MAQVLQARGRSTGGDRCWQNDQQLWLGSILSVVTIVAIQQSYPVVTMLSIVAEHCWTKRSSKSLIVDIISIHIIHGSLNVPIEHHPTIRYMVYNGYYKVMSNIPKMDSYQPLSYPMDFSHCSKPPDLYAVNHCHSRGLDTLKKRTTQLLDNLDKVKAPDNVPRSGIVVFR